MDAKVYELLNDPINKELYSAYLYLDMANFYADKGLAGFQNWFTIQAQEERDHALLFLQFRIVVGPGRYPNDAHEHLPLSFFLSAGRDTPCTR